MSKGIHLRRFKASELIFDDEQTVTILKFIFSKKHDLVGRLVITDEIRGFAQALLLEAVDASYALGFVDALFGTLMKPQSGVKKVLVTFGRKALKHWFKHATTKDLMQIKVYDVVIKQLAASFSSVLEMHELGIAKNEVRYFGLLALKFESKIVWG
ncbi:MULTISPECIES: hypothetical protein [unclassified Shewanella]|uniref:hypothetical protein n=1 Tax=unclassified Shewanella TaxID=196818 RepID=UPI00354F8728